MIDGWFRDTNIEGTWSADKNSPTSFVLVFVDEQLLFSLRNLDFWLGEKKSDDGDVMEVVVHCIQVASLSYRSR